MFYSTSVIIKNRFVSRRQNIETNRDKVITRHKSRVRRENFRNFLVRRNGIATDERQIERPKRKKKNISENRGYSEEKNRKKNKNYPPKFRSPYNWKNWNVHGRLLGNSLGGTKTPEWKKKKKPSSKRTVFPERKVRWKMSDAVESDAVSLVNAEKKKKCSPILQKTYRILRVILFGRDRRFVFISVNRPSTCDEPTKH